MGIDYVMFGALAQAFDLFGTQLTHHFGRAAHDHGTIGKLFAFGDQGARPHQTIFAYFRTIEHHRTNANE